MKWVFWPVLDCLSPSPEIMALADSVWNADAVLMMTAEVSITCIEVKLIHEEVSIPS